MEDAGSLHGTFPGRNSVANCRSSRQFSIDLTDERILSVPSLKIYNLPLSTSQRKLAIIILEPKTVEILDDPPASALLNKLSNVKQSDTKHEFL